MPILTGSSGRLPVLDGIRGIAIAMVMFLHFVGEPAFTGFGGQRLLQIVIFAGGYGVELFFVLSGFLITGILCDTRDSPRFFRNFYARRALRIFPLYYGVLVLLLIVLPRVSGFEGAALADARSRQAWLWFYGVNFLQALDGQLLPYVSHFWSLAVEEHFYLMWPLLVWSLPGRPLLAACAVVGVGSALARVVCASLGVNEIACQMMTFTHLDGLCLGAFLAVYVRELPDPGIRLRRAGVTLLAAGAVGVLATMVPSALGATPPPALLAARPSCVVLLLAALLAFGLTSDTGSALHRLLTGRVLRILGKYSYGLYVFHAFVAEYLLRNSTLASVERILPGVLAPLLVQAAAGMLVSMALAVLSYEAYERRFLVLKARFH